ncbi:hypothetical protein BJG92_01322 [Arthrobacter sp. SO5]|nr:hypothetical protein [Arthrobacter sp. SO5]
MGHLPAGAARRRRALGNTTGEAGAGDPEPQGPGFAAAAGGSVRYRRNMASNGPNIGVFP